MNKYLIVMLTGAFAALTYQFGIGYVAYIPIVFFIATNNIKNLAIIVPMSLASVYFLQKVGFWLLVALYALVIIHAMLLKKKDNKKIDLIYIFSTAFVLNVVDNIDFLVAGLLAVISCVLWWYFEFNIDGALKMQNNYRNWGFIEVVLGFVITLGGSFVSIKSVNIGLILALFFTMYLATNLYHIQAFMFSIVTMAIYMLLYDMNEAMLILATVAGYSLGSIYGAVLLVVLAAIMWLVGDVAVLALSVVGVVLFFELFKSTIVSKCNTKVEFVEDAYSEMMNQISQEVLGFTSFLDLVGRSYSTSKEYDYKISEGINSMINHYCMGCYHKDQCLAHKVALSRQLKEIIIYARRSDYSTYDDDIVEFYKSCPYAIEMHKSALVINDKLNIGQSYDKMQTLIAQVNGVSNVIRQYTTDMISRYGIDYSAFYAMKKGMIDYGYNVAYFCIKKAYVDDFVIEVGIRGVNFFDIKDTINSICDNYVQSKTSIIFIKYENNKTYFNIVKKVLYKIDYGFGSLAQERLNGDNYLIKELSNSRFVCAISDGMGKGTVANNESANTINLVDEITKTPLAISTALQILNTFFFIQEYLEKYSTLDFLEIDRSSGDAAFYKMGANTSYLFHKNGTFEKIENESLPFGLEEEISEKKVKLNSGDVVIMTSDGVFENIQSNDDLENYIMSVIHLSSQSIANEIMNYAKNAKRNTNDDISIIALKVIAA